MRITFLGLSCFLIESQNGSRVLVDPYNDTPEFSLGLKLPDDLQADLFLVSHPDEDHSMLKSKWTRKEFKADFPELHLKGTLVKEHAGDLNIAFSYTIDSLRLLHLVDNSWPLITEQLEEIGKIDILFISPPKVIGGDQHIQNIKALHPKAVILSHHIPPQGAGDDPTREEVINGLRKLILQDGITNPHSTEKTVEMMANIYEGGIMLQEVFENFEVVNINTIEIDSNTSFGNPTVFHFRSVSNR
jgi:L-ascorbate metabolism protein UlaG (beta-lactamase superfamily)